MKLTKEMKHKIREKAIQMTFAERSEALAKESNRLAELVYTALYPPEIVAAMNRLPEEFFSQTRSFAVKISKQYVHVNLTSSRRIGAHHQYRSYIEYAPENGEILTSAQRLVQERTRLEADTEILRAELRTLITPITTMKRLRELWPEGEEFYKSFDAAPPKDNLPAVDVPTLNSLMQRMRK